MIRPQERVSHTDAQLVARARRLADAVVGPGMGTTIRGEELRALIGRLDRLEGENAKLRAGAPLPTEPAAPDPADDWLRELPGVVTVVADVLEAHPELWGSPLVDALDGYASQKGLRLTDAFRGAVERALEAE